MKWVDTKNRLGSLFENLSRDQNVVPTRSTSRENQREGNETDDETHLVQKCNIYEIQYLAYWRDGGEGTKNKTETEKYVKWVESVYDLMTPYVSKSPRGAYVNFRDLELGKYVGIRTKYEEARVWGVKYFKNNFDRLVRVKTSVDPTDFFRDEQSIPPFRSLTDS
ncbi:PREDICTED: cannabidiolic acid synthase-like 1 [Tarenaya hassleriana]|uniref:cannabidiolic acid synthase-like 1 n=1 Tax=Tarenaya hassleriana TaxID=28532 RepID=UPI0008FD7015|nr:PREDICTED: cannabidiolic acid synthase-like 1 [Tarenaya hassleriana]